MSAPDLTRTWQARADAHEAQRAGKPGIFASPSDMALTLVAWLAIFAVLALAAMVGLTVAHVVLTTALNLSVGLDGARIMESGW